MAGRPLADTPDVMRPRTTRPTPCARRSRVRVIFPAVPVLVCGLGLLLATSRAVAAAPTNDEYALLVLTNQFRADPSALGYADPVVPPLAWNANLAAAARAHSVDMATNGCFDHDSCDGTLWSTRVGSYYPNWSALGENIAEGQTTVQEAHADWVASPGHRANLLSSSFAEFGSGIAVDGSGTPFYTEDFGNRSGVSIPFLPAGAVLPRTGAAGTRSFMVNYYAAGGAAPQGVWAIIGTSCQALPLVTGTAAHGTYRSDVAMNGSGCVSLVFEAVTSTGVQVRFPSSGAILVGVGASCAETTTTTPTLDCSAGPTPTPTPAPTPPPGLSELQVQLYPAPMPDRSRVRVDAMLPALASFDPTSGPVTLTVSDAVAGTMWTATYPALCAGVACFRTSAARSLFRASSGPKGPALTFRQNALGMWHLRFWSQTEDLGTLSSGTLTLSLQAGGLTLQGSAPSVLQGRQLVAQ